MLKQRIFTAIFLIALVLLLILFSPFWLFCLASLLILSVAAWEWGYFVKRNQSNFHWIYPAATLFLTGFFSFFPIAAILAFSALWWLCMGVYIFLFPQGAFLWEKYPAVRICIGWFILIPFFFALILLYKQAASHTWIIFLLFLVAAADTGAYFIGKRWGKHKLAPAISPHKSWEGLVGGLCFSAVLFFLFALLSKQSIFLEPSFILLCLITVLFSVVGDLTESMAKRLSALKDSSHLLPGHGGVLDRIDGYTAAFPIFVWSVFCIHL